MQLRRQMRLERKQQLKEKLERGFDKDIKLEKGDLPAIIISGMICFVLPIMLLIGAACGLAYLFFV